MKNLMHIFALLCITCAHDVDHTPIPVDAHPLQVEVSEKLDLYCTLAEPKVMEQGWAVRHGDGLLFTALHTVGCGYPGIRNFQDADGRFYRDPERSPVGLHWYSTFSKDMATGMLFMAAYYKDARMIDKWIEYGDARDWKVGEALENEAGLVIMTPSIVTLAFDVQAYTHDRGERATTDEPYAGQVGFDAHLSVLRQLTKAIVNGGVTDRSRDILILQSDREPENALYACSAGLFSIRHRDRGMTLLADSNRFPTHSLPSGEHYSTPYLFERDQRRFRELEADRDGCIHFHHADTLDPVSECGLVPARRYKRWVYNDDWLPDTRVGEFDGTDFVLAATLCLSGLP